MKKNKLQNNSGFTLIETIIYIVLFAFIMTGALVSVYGLLGSNARNQAKVMLQEEGSFLLGKIDWVLGSAKTVSVSADKMTLIVTRFTSPLITFSIPLAGGNMSIQRGSDPVQDLNNSNVNITCEASGCFIHTLASGDGINPESISAKFTVNTKTSEGLPYSQIFSTIKFLRK